MFDIKVIKDALSIDHAEKRWPVRFLFLFVFTIEILSLMRPLGNQDLTVLFRWYESVYGAFTSSDPASLDLYSIMIIPPEVIQNFIYMIFVLLKFFFYLLLVFYASGLYIGERKKILPAKMFVQYIKRLPWLFVFLFVMCVFVFIFMMMTVIVPFLFSFVIIVIPFLFLSANLIIIDKKNPIDAWIYCVRYSRGKRFWLIFKILMIYMLYNLVYRFLLLFVPPGSPGSMMIGAALFAYLLCTIGRLSGIYYYKVNVSELFV